MRTREAPIRNALEYGAARMLVAVAAVLPRRWIHGFCAALGRIGWWFLGGRRRVVRDNLRLAYRGAPDAPRAEVVGPASVANLVQSFLELFLMPADPDRVRATLMQFRGPTPKEIEARFDGAPCIWAAAHFGAWEVLGSAGPLLGFDVTTLVRPLDNPLLQEWVARKRTQFGAQLAASRGGLADLVAAVEDGRQVAILADLNHRGRGAAFIDFFGVKAATARTIAVLALKYDRPVIPVFCHRMPDGRFGFDTGTPIVPNRSAPYDAEVHRILQEVADTIETRIRERPGAWLWTHRRWKTRPPESAAQESA